MTTELIETDEIVARWRMWATQACACAANLDRQGERFDAVLKRARGSVRAQAADLLRSVADPGRAAELMWRHAVEHSVRTPPLIGYDQAAVNYTVARTWQACARELDPELPEVQLRWL